MKGLTRAVLLVALAAACTAKKEIDFGTESFRVDVVMVNGADPPPADDPLPTNTGKTTETWDITVEALGADGKPTGFDGFVRVSVQPGAVVEVQNATGEVLGRNLRLAGGKAAARVVVTAVYGEARLWVEDLGYVPAPAGKTPQCANGKNDDEDDDVLVDFPNDPGCAFADDDSETAGAFSAGVSPPVHYALPSVQDVQGGSSASPFPFEAIEVNTSGVHELVVTRVSKDGFYVTDLSGQSAGYNHLFAFNFSTPRGMRVCDRVTYLAGTVNEFFGFTELSFPSFGVEPLFEGQEDQCKVPDPVVLRYDVIEDPVAMERLESALVRVEGFRIPANFGPAPALYNVFGPEQSNCDLNGDGRVDFENEVEASCANECNKKSADCSEWTSYISRGNYKVIKDDDDEMGAPQRVVIQIQTDGAPEFNPVANRGSALTSVTGTLRNFSGGSLNWTVEARCVDDVVCAFSGCSEAVKGPKEACVKLRTEGDNDEGTN